MCSLQAHEDQSLEQAFQSKTTVSEEKFVVADKKNQVATSYQRQQFGRGRGRANFNCSHGRGKGRPDFDNQRNPRGNKKQKPWSSLYYLQKN